MPADPVGLYLHIPFCEQKCGYCDFVSYVGKEQNMRLYLDAMIKEAEQFRGIAVDTVFIGGGTPSFLPNGSIAWLMDAISEVFHLLPGAECSIEANPNSLTREKASEYRSAGINRISIGLQAVQDGLLKKIGRLHSYADFLNCMDGVIGAGFQNINVDLMYSLPGQSIDQVRESAQGISCLPVAHVSAYALKLERGTPMYGLNQPDEETDRAMFYAIRDVLADKGIIRYEISNFAKPGYECRHNLKYWMAQEYIGLGAAAHSYFDGKRSSNEERLEEYIGKVLKKGSARVTSLPVLDSAFEHIMLKTRLCRGISMDELPNTPKMKGIIEKLDGYGLVTTGDHLCLTDRGLDLQNSVVIELAKGLS